MSNLETIVDNTPTMKITKNNIKRFFKLAQSSTAASDWPSHKLAAVITYKNKVLSIGWNCLKEAPLQKKFNKYRKFNPNYNKNCLHAEINALSKVMRNYNLKELDTSKMSIFIYRQHKNGELALSKPCPACEAALRSFGIKNVYYTGNQSIIFEHYK